MHEWHNHFALSVITPPAIEPVTVSDVHSQSRIDITDDDSLLGMYITAARIMVEKWLRKQLITAQWRLTLNQFPREWSIWLPRPPLQTVEAVRYLDFSNTWQTFAPSNYIVDTYSQPGRVALAYAKFFPPVLPVINAVEIDYTTGFGNTADTVPATIKVAITQLVAHWYENREPVAAAGGGSLPFHLESLLSLERAGTYP